MKIKTLSKLLAAPLCVLLILLLCASPAVADGTDVAYDICATDAIGADVTGVDATNVTDDIAASDAIDVDATVVDEFVADDAVGDDVLVDDTVHDILVPDSGDVAGEIVMDVVEANTLSANVVGVASASYEDIVFTDWTSSTSMPSVAGNYRLMNDVSIYITWYVSTDETNLDLNGHSLTILGRSGVSVISVGRDVILNLYDRVGTGKITGGKDVNYGGGVSVGSGGNFTMYGGNINGNTAKYGGGVNVDSGGNFTMYGGNITGSKDVVHGGGVHVSGTFSMYGGNIAGNSVKSSGGGGVYVSGNFTQYGGNITGNTADSYYTGSNGGGVYVSGNFTQCGGNITGNTATYSGGGVYVYSRSSFIQSGGNIIDNIAKRDGGGVYVSGNFIQSGGNITDNTAYMDSGGGVYVAYGNFTQSGGNMTGNTAEYGGGVYVYKGNFTISGSANILADNNIYIVAGNTISISGDEFTGSVANITGPAVSLGYNLIKIDGDVSPASICDRLILSNTVLELCPNGVDGLVVVIKGSKYSPNTFCIWLNCDITLSETLYIYDTVNLDLNGYTLQLDGNSRGSVISVYGKNAVLNLYDNSTSGDGRITGGNTYYYGGGVSVGSGGNFTMYGGIISGNTAERDGGGVLVSDSSFTQCGGNITGNTAYGYGGGVYSNYGNFTQCCGNINGNTAKSGGGVYVDYDCNFTMYGGTITGNTADYGGGVYVTNSGSSFTLSGGTINGNTANSSGGGVYVTNNGSSFTFSGGTISSNTASSGGGVYVYNCGNFTMSGGTISSNTAEYGGGVYIFSCNFTQYGGNITGNTAEWDGGGVSVSGGNVIQSGGNIAGNIAEHNGGGVYVWNNGNITQSGGNITDNSANMGGGVCVGGYGGGTFIMNCGTISGNTASGYGGGVSVLNGCTITMSGGNIQGNTASGYGGGVSVYGNFTMSGVTITGNTASRNGGGIHFNGNAFNLSGGTVINNTVSEMENNVYLSNDKYITVDPNGVADNTNIGVTTQNASTASTPISITGVNNKDYSQYFFADNPNNCIENRNNVLYLALDPSTHWMIQLNLGTNMTAQDASKLNQQVKKGTAITPITLTAYPGYCFDKSDYPNENGLVYTVSADKKTLTITGTPTTNILKTLAPASESPHSITVSTNGNGTATASPTSAKSGTTVTLTATPSSGYAFSEWQVISGDIQIESNAFIMPFGDVSIKAIFLPEYLVPVEDTTESVNAATAAEVGYRVTPVNIQEIKAPSITRGGRSLVLDEKVVVKVTKGGVEIDVPASVNADGTVNVADADIAGADSVSVTFVGRKIGDVSGDGSPNTLDAAMILKASAEIEALDVKGDFYGDVTNDGQTTTLDAARILQHSADMTDENYELT